MKTENIVKEKSYAFALRIIKAYRFLSSEQREFVLSKQMLRSGTAIGALIREAEYGQSIPDFVHKLSIALKEANETLYWLMLLKDSGYIDERSFSSIEPECIELIKLLTSIINSSKKNQHKEVSQ
jgi:four helix bundle protein